MTEAQKKWLDDRPHYRVVGARCGRFQFGKTGWLSPDGRFGGKAEAGAFVVGVLEATDAPPSDGMVPLCPDKPR